MEDTKLNGSFFLKGKRRRGIALPLALVVILTGSLLIAAAFGSTVQFRTTTERQQETYVEHMTVTDYVEEAKGRISDYNANVNEALHVPDIENDAVKVRSPRDLQITAIPGGAPGNLSLDVTLPGGRQAVTMRVYDVAYTADKVDSSVPHAVLAEIPAPMLIFRKTSIGTNFEIENAATNGAKESDENNGYYYFGGSGGSDSTFDAEDVEVRRRLSLKQVGSYLVRVELFDVNNGERKRKRLVEEAFFQISSPDS
jgi:hypothetical protein